MMETDLTAYVQRQAAITALIGSRFEPVINTQGAVMPAVSYQVISGPRDQSHDGPGLTSYRVQLTVTDTTYTGMVAVAKLLASALDGKRWSGVDGNYVSFVENELDGMAPSAGQAGFFLRRMDVVIQC